MNKSRAVLELVLAITFYVVILIISLKALTHIENQSLKVLVSLLPVLPVILVIWVIIRQFIRFDELQRKIQLQALAISFLGTAFLTFSYGFLENIGFPKLTMFIVWPMMGTFWSMSTIIGSWYYNR
ncbi:hypothetical protein N5J48_02710 [Acinetobacter ursingii]|uniref:Uncharacterized protein n=3 Tax=Acinetobacter TaxID=469 RepID=N9D6F2_9GAMM|nr:MULTISPECIES: hypothetical protein [Acinetobacter]ENV74533.1 hypothetical protein F944_03174 [Acinetobacter ursingii DSM 16037 = CIP 107286]ENV78239.1 hypothetical protein F942_03248 [Acinetobacter ursingii ANC 3649]MBJ9983964.1 hypothetical protein [Acinetobacter sp. S40]MCU4306090.1 hypothetical protein [Acinetobacter ursingii]MCU4352500.1 hypothetical protein [Acinetobacter ursingii]